MKRIIVLSALLVITMSAFSQAANDYISVSYQGYINGQYVFAIKDIESHSPSYMNYEFNYKNATITATSTGWNGGGIQGTTTLYLTGAFSQNATFAFWPTTNYGGNPNVNPVTVNMSSISNLPVKFTGAPKVIAVYEDYVTVQFTVADQSQMKQYNVQFSKDQGKTWQTVSVVIPNNAETGYTYSVNVKLNQ